MTLNLLTHVPEGLVMLADSMVSSSEIVDGEVQYLNFEHARKLFHLGEAYPAAAMINGAGSLGSSPVSQLLRDASRLLDAQKTPVDHDVCLKIVADCISPKYDEFVAEIQEHAAKNRLPAEEISHTPLIVIVGSYFEDARASQLSWPGAERYDLATDTGGRLWWWGSGSVPLRRLIKGIDFAMLAADVEETPALADALRYFEANGSRYGMPLALDVMPVQQAIYFTEYLASVAAGYDRFKVGPHTVGGEVDVIALVDRKLKWIHKQRLISSFDDAS
jgi:hypothetical protein